MIEIINDKSNIVSKWDLYDKYIDKLVAMEIKEYNAEGEVETGYVVAIADRMELVELVDKVKEELGLDLGDLHIMSGSSSKPKIRAIGEV